MVNGKTIVAQGQGVVSASLGIGAVKSVSASGAAAVPATGIKVAGALLVLNAVGVTVFNANAGETSISALRCIVMRSGSGFVASSDDVSCANVIAGISTTAACSLGASFLVQGSGVIEDSSFSWQDNLPIFCGPDGRLTQTPPTSGFIQQVAIPDGPNKLEISLQLAIKRV